MVGPYLSTLCHTGIGWQILVHAFKPKSGLNNPKLDLFRRFAKFEPFYGNRNVFQANSPKFKWQGRFATTTSRTGVLAPIKPCWAFVGRMLGVCWARVGSVLGTCSAMMGRCWAYVETCWAVLGHLCCGMLGQFGAYVGSY